MITDNDSLWNAIAAREGKVFTTCRGKTFTFHIKTDKAGDTQSAIVIDTNRVSITRATTLLAYHNALDIQSKKGFVKKPGKLGTFGAIYLYPVFLDIGIISAQAGIPVRALPEETEQKPIEEAPGYCPNCGYTLSKDFEFCPKCGRKI